MHRRAGERRRADPVVVALAGCAALSAVVATIARIAVLVVPGRLLRTEGAAGVPAPAVVDLVAGIGACAAGVGVLCFGAFLVAVVLRHRGARVPIAIGVGAVVLAVGAVGAGVLASRAPGLPEAAGLSVLRTALAGLAAASLPAVALGAVRARAAHRPT